MEKKTSVILFLITLLAFGLRLFGLVGVPPSLNWDEVSHGYNAYSILKTGSDEWGQKFPLFNFRAYGDYPLPLNLYLTIPFILVFGLTELAIRLPHVMLGTLTVISTYFLAIGLTKRREVSLLSAFLVAISPWTLFTSRFVLQSNISVFLLATSLALFLNREKNSKYVLLSIVSMGLSMYAYHTTRILAIPMLLALLLIYGIETFKFKLKNIFIVLFLFVPIPFVLMGGDARARSFAVGIVDEGAVAKIEHLRNNSSYSPTVTRFLYNKPVYFLTEFGKNYLDYFSPQFLFLRGGTQYQFSLPNHGLMYWITLPFFYLGLILLLLKSFGKFLNQDEAQRDYLFIFIILLLAPIPASITSERFAVLRSSGMIPLPMLMVSLGFFKTLEIVNSLKTGNRKLKISRHLAILSFIVLLLLFLENYFTTYATTYRRDYSQSWQYGYKEVTQYLRENNDNYAKIVVTKKYGEPHEFLLFYLRHDPQLYKENKNLNRFYQSNWWWVDGFDKYYFVNDWDIAKTQRNVFVQESKKTIDCRQAKCLLVTSPGNVPAGWNMVKTINFLDDSPAFELYENN